MRGTIPGLGTPHPLGSGLPAIYLEDDLAQRLLAALDEVLAPVLCTLDNLDHYLDPSLAPLDFVEWLAGWVGAAVDESWPPGRRRELVARTVALYRRRGTVGGITEQIELATGGRARVGDSGGVGWSTTPGAALPGTPRRQLAVRVAVPDPAAIDQRKVEALVAAAKPAHVAHQVEVVGG